MPNTSAKAVKTLFLIVLFLAVTPKSLAGTTAPTTTATKDPVNPNGNNSWYVTPVQVTLQATDLESGVQSINYKLNDEGWQTETFSDSVNLTTNPSFETAAANETGVLNWGATTIDADTVYSQDTFNYAPNFSTSSAKVVTTEAGWHGVNNLDNFAVSTSYTNMNASLWLKTENVTQTAQFKLYAIHTAGDGSQLETLLYESATLTGTNDWTYLSTNFVLNAENALGVYIDIGLTGPGTVWTDAVTIKESLTGAETTITVGADGEHTLSYYSVDRAGNTELTNSTDFKIDQTPPGNWHDAGAFRGWFGSNHDLWVYTNVDDETSGLSVFSDKYQYKTESDQEFGRYQYITSCNSGWQAGSWMFLITPPFQNGVSSSYLLTPKTDFCNSNWHEAKYVRFFAKDMAGNESTKDYMIYGPWVQVLGKGGVRAEGGIDMLAEAENDNTDGIIESGNSTIDFFTSSLDWVLKNSPTLDFPGYDEFWDMTFAEKTELTGDLPITDGVFYYDSDLDLSNPDIPNNYDDEVFTQVIFVNGDLTISSNIDTQAESAPLFIVKGDVKIEKNVSDVQVGLFSDQTLYTAFDVQEGHPTNTLNLRGIYAADIIAFQRTLQGTNNDDTPSEIITFNPSFLVKMQEILGETQIEWLTVE